MLAWNSTNAFKLHYEANISKTIGRLLGLVKQWVATHKPFSKRSLLIFVFHSSVVRQSDGYSINILYESLVPHKVIYERAAGHHSTGRQRHYFEGPFLKQIFIFILLYQFSTQTFLTLLLLEECLGIEELSFYMWMPLQISSGLCLSGENIC